MLVKNWMHKAVIAVDVDDSMYDAIKRLKEKDIHMLPVMKKNKLVGIVTDRDLKRASASDATSLDIHELLYLLDDIKVEEIMTKDPITVPVDLTVEETAEILRRNRISGAPVVDDAGDVVGTITKTDIFRLLISFTGVGRKGIQFAFRVEDRPGSIKEMADIIRKYGGRMTSILSTYEGIPKGFRNVYIRMFGIDRAKLPGITEEFNKKATVLCMVDHREDKREIYED